MMGMGFKLIFEMIDSDLTIICIKIRWIILVEIIVDTSSFQDNSCGGNKLVHLVEQVPLYQIVYLPILVHSSFLIEFFVHCHWVLLRIVKKSHTEEFQRIF